MAMHDRLSDRPVSPHLAEKGAPLEPLRAAEQRFETSRWRAVAPYLGATLALVLFAGAAYILHEHLAAYRPHDIRRALRALEPWQLASALAFAVANYLVLTVYDVQALRHVARPLPYGRVAVSSFTAYAFSHALGFGSLIGASVRYRLYTPLGLSAGEVAEVAAFVTITFMTGLAAIFPIVLLLDPDSLGAVGIPSPAIIAFAVGALALTLGYAALGWWIRRPIRIFGYALDLPRPATALAQIALGTVDLLLVAAILYLCLPANPEIDYPRVLAVFVLGFVAGLISHVPGGLGVFDTVIIVGLAPTLPTAEIVAALLAFRVIYQLVPLLIAGVVFGTAEALAARRWIAQRVGNFAAWTGALEPMVTAACAFLGGVVLLFSNATPVSSARMQLIQTVVPLAVVEAAHFLGSVAGMVLLILSQGLQYRLRAAWLAASWLLAGGAVSALLSGLAWEEATVLLVLLLVFLPAGREFHVHRPPQATRYTAGWFLAVAVVLVSAFWLGLFSYKHLDHPNVLWWRFAFYSNASRFLRASVGVSVVALAIAAYRLLIPLHHRNGERGADKRGGE
jgi:phosphatidylglycerol lysyltransferase